MTKHYIEFIYPGFLFSESNVVQIENRNTSQVTLPKNSYGYRFFDKEEIIFEDEILLGKRKNISGITYQGIIYTLEEVRILMPNETILIENMEINGYPRVVKVKSGQCFCINEEDTVING